MVCETKTSYGRPLAWSTVNARFPRTMAAILALWVYEVIEQSLTV